MLEAVVSVMLSCRKGSEEDGGRDEGAGAQYESCLRKEEELKMLELVQRLCQVPSSVPSISSNLARLVLSVRVAPFVLPPFFCTNPEPTGTNTTPRCTSSNRVLIALK